MSLSTLKKSNSLDKLLSAVEKDNVPQEKKSYVDERLWKPVLDKVGNGYGEQRRWANVNPNTITHVNGVVQ